MVRIIINNKNIIGDFESTSIQETLQHIAKTTVLDVNCVYLMQEGKRCVGTMFASNADVHCVLRQLGGKGGFGSMLRAIGAQIEKTTNREACRDLSGRRLRDINEEKRLKAWLDKQEDREKEAEKRKKRKIEKLLTVPKHDFADEQYEKARSKLTEKVNDAVEEGFKRSMQIDEGTERHGCTSLMSIKQVVDKKPVLKRSSTTALGKVDAAKRTMTIKKKRTALWIDDDLSDGDDSDDCEDLNQVV